MKTNAFVFLSSFIMTSNQNVPVCLMFGKSIFKKVESYLNPTIVIVYIQVISFL